MKKNPTIYQILYRIEKELDIYNLYKCASRLEIENTVEKMQFVPDELKSVSNKKFSRLYQGILKYFIQIYIQQFCDGTNIMHKLNDNIKSQSIYDGIISLMKDTIDRRTLQSSINIFTSIFIWKLSNEGFDFWNEKQNELKKFILRIFINGYS